ncbi:MAG: 5'-3' exonuclease H3TH domain-containing protein, partial [Candidatus Cryptobacteroides sp.]
MKDRLFLIDGHALVFKMYYAFLRRPMINSKGEDTSILFGFMKYLLEMIHREEPTHLAVAFDPPGGTFRNEMYPEYKANRDETPQLVIDALEPLKGLCKALDIPVLMMPGFEADDVIGSMAKQMKSPDTDIYMVTPDKDYGQLVDEGIFQYRPGKAGENAEIYDEKAICAKYGISSPSQVIEMLTICGDTADNVPGVKGVGEVGAAKLIARYGSVENIYNHLDELTPRQREQFLAAKDHIRLSHDLVTIKTDIPLDVKMEDMLLTLRYDNNVAELFDHYEFNSLKKLVPESANVKASVPDNARRLNINEIAPDKMTLEARMNGMIAVSIEKTDLQGLVATVATCTEGECRKGGNEDLNLKVSSGPANLFKDILEESSIAKYGKDLKAQSGLLAEDGITLCGKQLDIALMHYLINPEKSHNIDILAKAYLDINIEAEDEVVAEPTSLFDIPEEAPENKSDIRRTASILPTGILIGDELRATAAGTHTLSDLYDNMEEPLMKVLSKMEGYGVKVDLGQLKEFADGLRKEMKDREERIREMTGEPELNISSPKQVGDVLFDKLKLDPKAKKTSRGSY